MRSNKATCLNHFALLLLLGVTLTQSARAQERMLVVKDTSSAMMVINPDAPQSATVVLYSSLSNLVISSPIELLGTSYDSQLGEYMITLRPNTAHKLKIQYPGFKAYKLRIPPTQAGEARFFVVEPPQPFISGSLVIEASPIDAEIQVQGLTLGEGSVHLDLSPGNYPVRIFKEGYEPLEFFAEIDFNESNVQRRSISLAKQPLTVTSNVERAKVFFQGREIGVTPIKDFLVEQGLAEIRVERTGYEPYVQMVDIRSDRNNLVDATLETQVNLLPSATAYIRNESASIVNDVLKITYDLASEKKRYNVDVVFLGPNNEPLKAPGLYGDLGKNVARGNRHEIYWPLTEGFSLDGVKVQVNAQPKSKVGWMIVGGGLGVGGGVALAVLSGWGGTDNPGGGGDGPGGGGR